MESNCAFQDGAKSTESITFKLRSCQRNGLMSMTVKEVHRLCRDPVTGKWHRPVNSMDLVYPGIYLGDATSALCVSILLKSKVTAVLNAAQGSMLEWDFVNTKSCFYKTDNIDFLGIPAIDLKHYDIGQHFDQASEFIDKVLRNKGTVLVHCVEGISRSATLVLAYLIMKKNLSLKTAIETVRKNRFIAPNEGFALQLIMLNDRLRK